MKIGIIGCGYVGKAAALHWKSAGHEVIVTTRSLQRAYELRPIADLVYILSDDWHDLIKKLDVVLLSVAPDAKSDYIQTYLRTTEALIQAVPNSNLQQIIYTSSTSVYGDHQGAWVDENSPLKPSNTNAQILVAAEQTLLNLRTAVCIFRLGEIYGPNRSYEEKLRQNQGKVFPGTGENYMNRIHINDIVAALDLAVEKKLEGIYNLCDDMHMKRKEFYEKICESEQLPNVQWSPSVVSPHAGNKKVSNDKLKSFGWFPSQ